MSRNVCKARPWGHSTRLWIGTGQAPTGSFVASFVAETLFLLLAYILIFFDTSVLVQNLGTALMVSTFLFLFFTFFWGLVSILVASALSPPGSVAWFEVVVTMSLFSPTGIYNQFLRGSLPQMVSGLLDPTGGAGPQLPSSIVASSASLWLAFLVIIAVWAMKYRAAER